MGESISLKRLIPFGEGLEIGRQQNFLRSEKRPKAALKDWEQEGSEIGREQNCLRSEKRPKAALEDWEQGGSEIGREQNYLTSEKRQKAALEDWEQVYSYEEKMLKSRLDRQGYAKWEEQHRSWEIQNGLVPIVEDWEQVYSYEEKRVKSLVDRQGYAKWEKQHRSWEIQNGLVPIVEDWEVEYSFEEKRLRSLVNRQGYYRWERKNWLWERENNRVAEEVDEMRLKEVRFLLSSLSLQDPKIAMEEFEKRLEQLHTKTLTEEEKKLKESYLKKEENWRLGLSKETFFPFGPGWDLAYHTLKTKYPTVQPLPLKKVTPIPKGLQHLCKKNQPTQGCSTTRVLSKEEERQKLAASREEERGKLAAEGRCFDGNYLTPYCKCNKKCYRFDTTLEGDPPEFLPIWLAYCRQFRQSHCFDIDDFISGNGVSFGGYVGPLPPSQDFEGRAESLMELANRAIEEYNDKECNVFKYKVLKIEKVNCSLGVYNTYWMTVKVLNLTLGTPFETFQIHAFTSMVNEDKVIYCCRPKEEVIVGLPSCEFCFGLLPESRVTEGKEP